MSQYGYDVGDEIEGFNHTALVKSIDGGHVHIWYERFQGGPLAGQPVGRGLTASRRISYPLTWRKVEPQTSDSAASPASPPAPELQSPREALPLKKDEALLTIYSIYCRHGFTWTGRGAKCSILRSPSPPSFEDYILRGEKAIRRAAEELAEGDYRAVVLWWDGDLVEHDVSVTLQRPEPVEPERTVTLSLSKIS